MLLKNKLLATICIAGLAAGCSTKDEQPVPETTENTTGFSADEEAQLSSEFTELPGVMIRVPVDAEGNELEENAVMKSHSGDTLGETSSLTDLEGAFDAASESKTVVGDELDADSAQGQYHAYRPSRTRRSSYTSLSFSLNFNTRSNNRYQGNYNYRNRYSNGYNSWGYSNSHYGNYQPRYYSTHSTRRYWQYKRPRCYRTNRYNYYYYQRPSCSRYSFCGSRRY